MTFSFDLPGGKDNYIMTLDNAIEKSVCDEAVEAFRRYYESMFEPGPTLGGLRPLVKSNMDTGIAQDYLKTRNLDTVPIFATLHSKAYLAVRLILAKYQEIYRQLWHAPGLTDTGFRVQHSGQGAGWYREHCDGVPWEYHSSGGITQRVLGVLIYLNDIEVGGGTRFEEQGQVISAKAGRIAIFPTHWTHPHSGLVPISSDKFIMSTFITCQQSEWDAHNNRTVNPESSPYVRLKNTPEDEDEIVEKDD
jgi:hypothetical protein